MWSSSAPGPARRVPLVSAVLGAPSQAARDADTLALLNYGSSRYRRGSVLRGARRGEPEVAYYGDREAKLGRLARVVLGVRRGERLADPWSTRRASSMARSGGRQGRERQVFVDTGGRRVYACRS